MPWDSLEGKRSESMAPATRAQVATANLLDSLTPNNREYVDRRMQEPEKEKTEAKR